MRRELLDGRAPRPRDRELLGADAVVRPGPVLRAVSGLLAAYERRPSRRLRGRALERCRLRVQHEQRASEDFGISPVSSLLNVLVLHASDAGGTAAGRALDALEYWRWEDPDRGIRYAGARSQTWDTAFAIEALLADGQAGPDALAAVARGRAFLAGAQLAEDIEDASLTGLRHRILGGAQARLSTGSGSRILGEHCSCDVSEHAARVSAPYSRSVFRRLVGWLSLVSSPADSPHRVEFAIATASSALSTGCAMITGPNVSSVCIGAPAGTCARTVGR